MALMTIAATIQAHVFGVFFDVLLILWPAWNMVLYLMFFFFSLHFPLSCTLYMKFIVLVDCHYVINLVIYCRDLRAILMDAWGHFNSYPDRS